MTVELYCGDCLEILPTLTGIDAVVTDPPFYLPARIATSRKVWPRTLADVGIMDSYFRQVFAECARALGGKGAFYTFSDSTSYAVFLSVCYPLFDRTQCICWDKVNGGLGNGWRHSNELILHGAFGGTTYAEGFRRDVLAVKTVPSAEREHASEKPIELLRQIIEAHPSGTILDPFMGSGTTGVACVQTGRNFIGIEIDPTYFALAQRRIRDAQQQLALPLAEVGTAAQRG
jgi:site-specific DNA-methyltransferase (adenine-specific)